MGRMKLGGVYCGDITAVLLQALVLVKCDALTSFLRRCTTIFDFFSKKNTFPDVA